ncbi:glycine--tRNA ligase subunit beta [Sphingomonas changnyeongensis]|uniref:Glycine--tRNA ligase beta subunit n=1 Tax=Sphingomonas changnyeongensis TaxID=2698679 RepID=A0A7Z2NVP5_9SPHN|nr:glycine--tRNA ligase subunit beta [Sphingomonas changnyeongensis]QHL90407.1 glycine--tRNA ligase subunit beta [Sphingomonas changnyeongensis]
MTDLLIELRSEEIPARMQARARADLVRLLTEELARAGIAAADMTAYSTPRRLAVIARGLPLQTDAVTEEVKGPRTSAPDQALDGFLRKTGLTRDQLVERDGVWFAVTSRPGRRTADVVAEAIPAIVRGFPWPKSMRWGQASLSTESLRWVRPLQGIIALLGDDVIECAVDGVASGRETAGHRFMHQGPVSIPNAASYADALRAAHVIVDQDERAAIIRDGAAALAGAAGLRVLPDDGLVTENAGLTEWPVPLLGRFDPAFLDVPAEVIQLTARVNQKYFVCAGADGRLAPAFVCVANIAAPDGGARIVAGNQKVLAARLSDARFFYDTDLKVPLADQAGKLAQIVFHEKLGTVADKVDRVARLARWLVEQGIVGTPDMADAAETAARLAKADLVTGMVGEFPELQGVMGGYYARAQGLPDAVADAIRDHYKPAGQGDDVPTAPVTVAVSLADKLDSITRFFAIDLKPSGSKDPFALRRSALGVIALILENRLRFPLGREVAADVLDFFADRLKVQQREAGVRHDLIDAVFALGGEDDLVRLLARVHALQAFIGTEDGANLLAGYKRAANILKKESFAAGAVNPAPEPAEAALAAALDAAAPAAEAAVAAEDFAGAMAALASLRGPIDGFFDQVTVNDADPAKRAARLGLLARMRDAVHRVADFSKIEG